MYSETAGLDAMDPPGPILHFGDAFRTMACDLLRLRPGARRRRREREERRGPEQAAWLRTLPPLTRQQVLDSMVQRELPPGELLLGPGEEPGGWYGVLEGFLEVEQPKSPAGARGNSFGLPQGAWFGEHFVLGRRQSDCRIVATVPTRVACLPRLRFVALLEQPDFCRFVMRVQAERIAALQQRLGWPRRLRTNTRVALRIADLFAGELLFDTDFRVDLTQAAMSEFLGLSRQRTNAALKHLESMGEIDLDYRCIRVRNPAKLAERALAGDIG